jgi:hypothetical protein
MIHGIKIKEFHISEAYTQTLQRLLGLAARQST